MAMRVKNISEGFVDANGVFHPIRAAGDYKAGRAGEKKKYKPGKKAAAKRKATSQVKTHKRVAAKRSVADIKKMLGVGKAGGAKKNPLPMNKWTNVKIKPLANGDVKILIK